MTLVQIVKSAPFREILRQTPGGKGVWDGIQFTLEPVPECDYVIILQKVPRPAVVRCPPNQIWALMEEPPNEAFKAEHRGSYQVSRVYTNDPTLGWRGKRYVVTHPALPWYVERGYDELVNAPVPEKRGGFSWITSNMTVFKGHRSRMAFFERIKDQLEFDLYGRGFKHIDDKWHGLAPYRYALAIENYSNPYYWSEKIVDCFLSWTMPIYYGCTQITKIFPAEAMVQIDIEDPDVVEKIREAVSSDRWARNLDAIAYAREQVLNHYQFFPFMTREIRAYEARRHTIRPPQTITLTNDPRRIDVIEAKARYIIGRHVTRHLRTAWASLRS